MSPTTQEKIDYSIESPASAGELAPIEPAATPMVAAGPMRTEAEDRYSPESLIALGIQKGMPVEALEKLMNLAKEVRERRAAEAFNEAMAAFQAECPIVRQRTPVMNKDGKTVRYLYAPLEQIVEDVKPYLTKNGLSYWFETKDEIGTAEGTDERGNKFSYPMSYMTTTCVLQHRLGHAKRSSFRVPIQKSGHMSPVQEVGSSSTFAKRYSFCNVTGVIVGLEDDDGRGGVGTTDEEQKPTQASNKQPTQATNGSAPPKQEPKQEPKKEAPPASTPAATPPANGQPAGAPTKKLGGDAKPSVDYKTLHQNLSEADRKEGDRIGGAIAQASGAKGDAGRLMRYRDAYMSRANLSEPVKTYLEALFWACWHVTKHDNLNPSNPWTKREAPAASAN